MHIPGQRSRREKAPSVARGKFTASVCPYRSLNQIAIIKRIIYFAKKGCFAELPVIRIVMKHQLSSRRYIYLVLTLSQPLFIVYKSSRGKLTYTCPLFRSNGIFPELNRLSISVIKFEGFAFELTCSLVDHIRYIPLQA